VLKKLSVGTAAARDGAVVIWLVGTVGTGAGGAIVALALAAKIAPGT